MKTKVGLLKQEWPASDLVTPRCRHFGPCGGCELQHLAYPAQLRWKMKRVEEVLRRETAGHSLPPLQAVPMEEPWGHRSKMEFSFGEEEGKLALGLHRRSSFQRIVDLTHCEIAPVPVSDLARAVKAAAAGFPLRAYSPKAHRGFWRYLLVRSTRRDGHLLAVIMTNEGPREPLEALARELPRQVPQLKSLYWGVTAKISDVARPERLELLAGSETLEDQIGPVRFSFGPSNFVQPNLALAESAYQAILQQARLTGREAVYDLYCGMGLTTLFLAKRAKAAYGLESEPQNVAFAERNAESNGITNAVFICGKVEEVLKGGSLFKVGPPPDVIVLDPPRAGLQQAIYGPLLQAAAPRLLYLSCNPASLGRDLKNLLDRDPAVGVEELRMFDFFPHTAHAEVLASLHRR